MWFWFGLAWIGAGFAAYNCRWIGRIIWATLLVGVEFIATIMQLGNYPRVPGLYAGVEQELLSTFTWVALVTAGLAFGGGWLKDSLLKDMIADQRKRLAEFGNDDLLMTLDVALSTFSAPWVISRWAAMTQEKKLEWVAQRREQIIRLAAALDGDPREWNRFQLVEVLVQLDSQ
jgi:hypothetical protein